jgi:F-type H+-transporting ATPase subunit b
MRFDWWTLALQTINLAVIVWLLHRFLYKPVLRMIDARKAEIQKQYDAAKAAEDEAKSRLASVDAERAGIEAEREATLVAAAARAQEAADTRRVEAEREAKALLDDARKMLASERSEALAEARRMALDLGSEFARRFLAEVPLPLRAEAWLEPIEHYLEGLPKAERDALVRQFADGSALTVITATALPPEIAETWRARLRRSLGEAITIVFDVDPELVAGTELHSPSVILRFSWRNALASMRKEIEADGKSR